MTETDILSITMRGSTTLFLTWEYPHSNWSLSVDSDFDFMTVYVSEGVDSNPNKYNYDLQFKDVPQGEVIKISRDVIPYNNFSVAVALEGLDFMTNEYKDGVVHVVVEKGEELADVETLLNTELRSIPE